MHIRHLAKPCDLALREAACRFLDLRHCVREFHAPCKIRQHFLVADALHRLTIRAHALRQERLHLFGEARRHHRVDALLDAPVQLRPLAPKTCDIRIIEELARL